MADISEFSDKPGAIWKLTGPNSVASPGPAQEELIAVTLEIDNIYEDGEQIQTVVQAEIPAPPTDKDSGEYEDWEYDHIFEHTGTGKEEGDAGYFVKVTASSRPDLLPVGTEYEFC